MKYVVDRLEGKYAVCESENRNTLNIPLSELPHNIKEGDCIDSIEGKFMINEKEQEKRKRRIHSKMNTLWK